MTTSMVELCDTGKFRLCGSAIQKCMDYTVHPSGLYLYADIAHCHTLKNAAFITMLYNTALIFCIIFATVAILDMIFTLYMEWLFSKKYVADNEDVKDAADYQHDILTKINNTRIKMDKYAVYIRMAALIASIAGIIAVLYSFNEEYNYIMQQCGGVKLQDYTIVQSCSV